MPVKRASEGLRTALKAPAGAWEEIDQRRPAAEAWRGSEHELQKSIVRELKFWEGKFPELELLHAVPNGGDRHRVVAAKMRAEGVRRGVPDLFLPVARGRYHGLYLELKRKGNTASPWQREWLLALHAQRYRCVVANDPGTAVRTVMEYLKLR